MKKTIHAEKGFHGSHKVSDGKLTGATGDTDYFFFHCPQCANGNVMRVLDYGVVDERESRQDEVFKKKVYHGFILAFRLYCEHCKLSDYVKLDNIGVHNKSVPQQMADEYNTRIDAEKSKTAVLSLLDASLSTSETPADEIKPIFPNRLAMNEQ